jgi:2-dehydro-3-deoxygluconokinase
MMENPSRKRVVVFGELLLRLGAIGFERFVQSGCFEACYTGAETNTAVSLANYGIDAYVVSKVPTHDVGQACVNYLKRYGLNTDFVSRGGDRLGLFYMETGAAQRPSKVIYDRKGSSITTSTPDDYDWDEIFSGKDWFHFSGTAPALGESVVRVLLDALRSAKASGVTVSMDLNYRSTLWSMEDARRIITPILQYVDLFIANEGQTRDLFEVAQGSTIADDKESVKEVAEEMMKRFDLQAVSMTLRESRSASANTIGGHLYDGCGHYFSRKYLIDPIVDRVGAGDAFSGGLIYGLLSGLDPQQTVEFAAAASCLKHSVRGDFNLVSLEEVRALMDGDSSGRVQR